MKPLEEIVVTNPTTCAKPSGVGVERKITRPQKEQALNCPRCNSTNTKFCYYNNYSLTQPRYFCKTCRRYWTEGGSLRNIPVGGGSRKNKRPSSSSSSTSTNSSSRANKLPDLIVTPPNPKILNEGQDLNLTFSQLVSSSSLENESNKLSSLELLTGRLTSNSNNFMPMQLLNPSDPTSFMLPIQDFKPTLSFSIDGIGIGNGFGNLHGVHETTTTATTTTSTNTTTNGRLLFPFEDLKTTTSHDNIDHIRDHGDNTTNNSSSGYWTGMLGGGSW